MLTLLWWAANIATPALFAYRNLRCGRRAMACQDYLRAERYLDRAACHPAVRQTALCLLAQAALQCQQPQKALIALDRLFDEPPSRKDRQPLFLRALACLALREGHAALAILAHFADRPDASIEERLAMVHACILVEDFDAACVFLSMIPAHQIAGPLRARLQLCHAAIHFHRQRWPQSLHALPSVQDCSADDGIIVEQLQLQLADKAE